MATKATNDKIAAAAKGQREAKAAKRAAKPTAPKAEKAAATRKPGNLRTTGLPNKVRTLRLKAGLTPAQLADKAGQNLTASHVRRIERGARHATPVVAAAIAFALGVEPQALGIKEPKAAKAKAAAAPAETEATEAPAAE